MIFFKPKFWDSNKISFFPILLLPITLIIKFLGFIKYFLKRTYKCKIPIICVGNIYLGGTGKTPLCIEIFLILKNLNKHPAFIRKKYSLFQDEASLQRKIGNVYENKKRVNAIKEAAENKADIAILDDGFQDFSFYKDLSIICFNEKQWIGNGLSIPSGPLRESLTSLKRANCVFINGKKNIDIESKIFSKNKKIEIFYSTYKPVNISDFKGKNIIAFAGIGNPGNFFSLLKDFNISTSEEIEFPDHYNYSDKDLKKLVDKAKKNESILLTTEKDYARIDKIYKKNINYLKVLVEIQNKEKFIEMIKKII